MKNLIGVILLLISQMAISQVVSSNDGGIIYLNKNTAEDSGLEGKRGGYFGSHALGDSIGLAYDKFLKLYVKYESEGGAYATEKKIIYKKEIYNSVNSLEKYFRKEVRSNNIEEKEAKARLGKILNSAIGVRFYDTSNLENVLSVTKDLERKEYYFNNIKFQSEVTD